MSPLTTFVSAAMTLAVVAVAGNLQLLRGEQQPLVLTHGIASGDVTDSSAVIWARASGPAQMHVEIATNPTMDGAKSSGAVQPSPETDYTAQMTIAGLEPDTRYWYRVWLAGAGGRGRSDVSELEIGTFKTAPAVWQSRPVSFVVGADVGGQRFCRNATTGGYSIFASMASLAPDFFIANGDMIYADGDCPTDGPDGPGGWQNIPGDFPGIADPSVDWTNTAEVREVYLRHWRYNRADPYQQAFLRSTSMYSQWDDHEVINDFGAPWTYWNSANINRAGFPNLVAQGLATFFAYSPIDRIPGTENRIYRSFRWGSDVEMFILDARSYRDRNEVPDTPENDKDMLGRDQIAWLVDGIRQSTATWKIVSSDVPISIGTGSAAFGRDAWANIGVEPTGFERELLRMLVQLDSSNAENVVFVTTDVHNAQTIAYDTDADGDGDRLVFHELVSGPLNAVRAAARRQDQLDPAAHPTSLFGAGGLFNFNYVRIARQADGKVHLIADVRNEAGLPLPGSLLDLIPR
jgi:alkaline phosphatase D